MIARFAACAFIDERMMNLKMEIIDAGFNPYADDHQLLEIGGDSQACFDARMLLDETLWQLGNIAREVQRRWPAINAESSTPDIIAAKAWMQEIAALL